MLSVSAVEYLYEANLKANPLNQCINTTDSLGDSPQTCSQ